ncbi:PREDICTED: LON peptidase N-terminal domain and RING finger protein 1-like isoform X1 [Sturnus vulgaris]|uniref:LON peptidase N-terminal domain and RING finger protein 1-like isoform X1 n=1 Tax=Sturnus vulgaris TaxID=9172 RepID=UPI00071A7A2D|nr:PREDICTED: LON peptidase N-terminal domain and RING finger protein 1-like isoform X1 [Sturnus vulgaris]
MFREDGGTNKGKNLKLFKSGCLGEITSLQRLTKPVSPDEEHRRTRLGVKQWHRDCPTWWPLPSLIQPHCLTRAHLTSAHISLSALDSSSLRLCRAEALVALGHYPQALEDLDAVCRAEPGEHEAFFKKGKVLLEMGQRAEALLAWEHCLTLSPHFQPARREMEKIIMEADAPQPCAAAHLGDAHLSSAGSQVDGGSPVLPSSTQAQGQEGELADGRGDAESEHSQDTATLSQPGQRQEPETWAESQGQWSDIKGNKEETAAKCTQPCLGESLSISDLECSLCIRMFFEPVTTPCGHTFCKECLERCLDHRPNCPLCKHSLREFLKAGRYSPTVLLQDIMLAIFPTQLAERRELHRAEMAELSNLTKNIPIFVCTMSFPGIPCPLHVFEPRYRLMIRRCQESGTRRFGMCIYENGKSFADYGCMLEIRQVELLADGRSLVDTIGRQRFRVLSRGHRDGYHTADIEYLEDKKVSGEELQELQSLHESTYRLAQRFCEHGDLTSRHILMQHGPLPEKEEDIQASADGPTWCWWLISILPLDPSYQLNLLCCTSLRSRLWQLQHVLTALLQQPPPRHLLPERSPRARV